MKMKYDMMVERVKNTKLRAKMYEWDYGEDIFWEMLYYHKDHENKGCVNGTGKEKKLAGWTMALLKKI